MNKLFIYLLLLLTFQSCQTAIADKSKTKEVAVPIDTIVPNNQVQTEAEFDIEKHLKNYQNLKRRIKKDRKQIQDRTDISSTEKLKLAQNYISKTLVDSIFPYWIGTTWDFNGYTEKPREGDVACGYFVSTTLRDVGIQLNRFKVAQKGATDIILELCDSESIERFSSFEQLEHFTASLNNGEILIVGLDFHVGFIIKKNEQSYFAHSNYIGRKGVEIEKLTESDALKNTKLYVIGNLIKNEDRMKRWLK